METPSNKISIDLNIYSDQLRGDISSDLTTLQILSNQISNSTYSENYYTLVEGMTSCIVSVPPLEFLLQREMNKCFKSIIGSVQDFMDKLIAVIKLSEEKIIPPTGLTFQDFEVILKSKFAEHLMHVSCDVNLKVPKKLNILLNSKDYPEFHSSLQSFFELRNGLEHHKGVAKKDRILKYKRIALASTTGDEILPPMTLNAGEGLVLKTFDQNISFDEGGQLLITRTQLDGMILNILNFFIPAMKIEAAKLINTKSQL